MMLHRLAVLGACGLCVLGAAARADDLFTITATGGAPSVTGGNHKLLDLVSDAVNARNEFSGFQGLDATYNLNYAGVQNAITITRNAANTQATVTLGPTGVVRTFTGANAAELDDQIRSYLKTDGKDDLEDFFKAINRMSRVAVSDGNPNATTARSAQNAFDRFGLRGLDAKTYRLTPEGERDGVGLQLDFGLQSNGYEAGDFDGGSVTLSVEANYFFTKRFGLSLGSFLALQTVEESDTVHFGTTLGAPIRPLIQEGKTGLAWQITPFVSDAEGASVDMAAGGALFGVGATNLLAWSITEKFTLSMANQLSWYTGRDLSWSGRSGEDFDLNPGVSQVVLKNGVRGLYRFNESWSGYASVTLTDLLNDAAVKDWVTPEVGAMLALNQKGTGFLFGISGDFGPDYAAFGGRFSFQWAF